MAYLLYFCLLRQSTCQSKLSPQLVMLPNKWNKNCKNECFCFCVNRPFRSRRFDSTPIAFGKNSLFFAEHPRRWSVRFKTGKGGWCPAATAQAPCTRACSSWCSSCSPSNTSSDPSPRPSSSSCSTPPGLTFSLMRPYRGALMAFLMGNERG